MEGQSEEGFEEVWDSREEGGVRGGSVGLHWRMPQKEGWRRMSRGGIERLLIMQVAMPFQCDTCPEEAGYFLA